MKLRTFTKTVQCNVIFHLISAAEKNKEQQLQHKSSAVVHLLQTSKKFSGFATDKFCLNREIQKPYLLIMLRNKMKVQTAK